MQHVLLKDVTPASHQWTVRTRVVRFCEYLSNDNPPRTLRVDLILLDEEGKAMEGQIPENWIARFKPQLTEDHVYYIKYFQVRNARYQYRPVDHAYMMRFTAHTIVQEVNPVPENFPLYAHAAVPFEVLRTRTGIVDYCSDAIGVFTGCTHVKIQNTRGGPKPLRNVHITDGRETVPVALWNQQAESFDAERYLRLGCERPLVFLFCAGTCRNFDGKLSLQGSTLCKWYANPLLPEVAALQDSCIGRLPAPTWVGPDMGPNEPQRISISELATYTNPHVIYNNRYIITARIKNIVPDQSWWYLACNSCNRTIQAHGAGYKCIAGTCNSTSASPRYRLPLIAMDPVAPQTGNGLPTIELVLFGPTAEEIIGAPVDALIASQAGVGTFLPTKITAIYGKVYDLRVSVSPGCLQRINISYQVDSVLGVVNAPLTQPELGTQNALHPQEPTATLPAATVHGSENAPTIVVTPVQATSAQTQSSVSLIQAASPTETPPPPVTPITQQPQEPTATLPATAVHGGENAPTIVTTPVQATSAQTQSCVSLNQAAPPTETPPPPVTPITQQALQVISDITSQKRPVTELEDEDYDQPAMKERIVRRKLALQDSPPHD